MQLIDREQLWRDAVIGGWLVFLGCLLWVAIEAGIRPLPTAGLVAATAAGCAVAYWRGRRFGTTELP